MIYVTKPHLPNRVKLDQYIDGIYQSGRLTNDGPLIQELTRRLEQYLGVTNLLLVANGTLALQIAYRALGITGQQGKSAITTPFTFAATASSLKWDGVQPRFADIDKQTWCLSPNSVEQHITDSDVAIVPVHVFGNCCEIEQLESIANSASMKLVFDASHSFGVNYKGRNVLQYGDASTISFHATKLFHTFEGGAIVFKNQADLETAKNMINFGITGPESISEVGINAKMNEFQAAVGLSMLDEIEDLISARKKNWLLYASALADRYELQAPNPSGNNNFGYFPLLMESSQMVSNVADTLKDNGVLSRRYFKPSLDELSLYGTQHAKISRDIASRVICLPLYASLESSDVERISKLILDNS